MGDSSFYDPDTLSLLPDDILSFPMLMDSTDHEFPNSFLSQCEKKSSSGLKVPDFYNQQVPPRDNFFPQISLPTPLNTPYYGTPPVHPLQSNIEEFLTPLISPAITPNHTDIYEFLDPPSDHFFTPLSSPALPPSMTNCVLETTSLSGTENNNLLSQQLLQIEAKQQQLREQQINSPITSPLAYRKSPLASASNRTQAPLSPLAFSGSKRTSLRHKMALASPQLNVSQSHPTMPATPASLMNMTHPPSTNPFTQQITTIDSKLPPVNVLPATNKKRKLAPSTPTPIVYSPRTLKPQMSPFLQPSHKSSLSMFTPIVENRRSAHKVAEQRRRDTLKQSFDSLRIEITDILVMDDESENKEALRDEKEKEVKLMSKVLLLQHSYEYIVRLKNEGKRKDEKMQKMQSELDNLRSKTPIKENKD